MKARVTAVLVVRQGGEHLARTLDAIRRLERKPDVLIAVDNSVKQGANAQLTTFGPSQILTGSPKLSFGESIELASTSFSAIEGPDDYLWFLAQDSAPTPHSLSELLAALEVSPSVAVAGPKQMDWDDVEMIHEFGLSLSPGGRTISLVHDELDQGQHDHMSDVLAVGANGLLVRHEVWSDLAGFDDHLRIVDDALDFCVRVRLAGHRVSVVPAAKVVTAGDGVIGANGASTARASKRRERHYRTAQLYRRLVYAPSLAVLWHWLGLLPSAIFRACGQLLAKRPGAVSGEFRAAFSAAFSGGAVGRARRAIREQRQAPWSVLSGVRLSRAEVRRRNTLAREAAYVIAHGEKIPVRFFSGGGAWVFLALLAVSLISLSPLIGANALAGGAVLPLSTTLPTLWANVGFGLLPGAFQLTGPTDPFGVIVALIGTLTWWQPSLAFVFVWFFAIPMAGLGAWFLGARLTQRAGIRAFISVGYGLAPTLLAALNEGRPAAVLAHLFLPWLFFCGIRAGRSWSASAATALLFAAVVACSPSLTPALLVIWIGSLLLTGRAAGHYLAIPLPTLALLAPAIVLQTLSLNAVGLAADPGLVEGFSAAPGWQQGLGFPVTGLGGWLDFASVLPWALPAASILVIILLGVLLALAFVGLFSQYPIRAQVALVIGLLGLATAILSSGLAINYDGEVPIGIWPGAGLSLAWLGLIVAAATGASILRRFSFYPVIAGVSAVTVLAIPALAAVPLGNSLVKAGSGQTLPAYVVAQSAITPGIGTLVLAAQPSGGLGYQLVRGSGLTLESVSRYVSTGGGFTENEKVLANVVANMASASGAEAANQLATLGIGFILLAPANTETGKPASASALAMESRVRATLDSNSALTIVGVTDHGLLWRYPGYSTSAVKLPAPAIPVEPWRSLILTVQGLIILMTLLLAIPTGAVSAPARPRRPLPGLIEGDAEIESVDPLSGVHDDEEN